MAGGERRGNFQRRGSFQAFTNFQNQFISRPCQLGSVCAKRSGEGTKGEEAACEPPPRHVGHGDRFWYAAQVADDTQMEDDGEEGK